jgi:hypothetical protein
MKKNTDLTGGSLTDLPNDKYKKFFNQFEEHKSLTVEMWRPVDILAYFCDKYKNTYEVNYTFKFNSPSPSKCFEMFQIKKLAQLISSKPLVLKAYIDWIFNSKINTKKNRFTSISFLTREEHIKEYKWKILPTLNTINRTTPLSDTIKQNFSKFNIQTFGELALMWNARETLNMDTQIMLEISIIASNIDISMLEKLK